MQRNPLLEAIADPSKNFLAFLLIGIFGLGIISNGFSNLLLETLGDSIQKNFGISKILFQFVVIGLIGGAIGFAVYFTALTRKLRSLLGREAIEITNVVPLTETFFGLITIASLAQPGQLTPAEIAIKHHWRNGNGKLRYCWLICTPDALDATRQFLQELERECMQQKQQFYIYHNTEQAMPPVTQVGTSLHVRIVDLAPELINDPNHIRQLIDSIYAQATEQTGLSPIDFIADYTGGTKSMTAGMVLACSKPERKLQYLVSNRDRRGKIIDSQLMKVTLSYRIKAIKS